MAKVVKKSNGLEERYQHHKDRAKKRLLTGACFLPVFLLCFGLQSALRLPFLPVVAFLAAAGGVVAFLLFAYEYNRATILGCGIAGEQAVEEVLSALPDTYTVYRNVAVAYRDKSAELDTAIVGPTGVFVIEVKNLNGDVRGDHEEKYWTQHKIGQKGTPYQKQIYSPVKQVRTHVFCLAGILQAAGADVFVQDGVFFSNPEVEVHLTGQTGRTPVFVYGQNGTAELLRYITQRSATLPEPLCQRINAVMEAL
ncbi:MAG: NERD domain-containing protein [Clostridia bacterium]|nr:NERD domain-containing protein [Clostridia bacterium]